MSEQHALTDPDAAAASEFAELATREQIATAAAALDRNGIRPLLAATGADARGLVGSLLTDGAEVYNNTSQTLEAIGVARHRTVRPLSAAPVASVPDGPGNAAP